MPALGQTKMKDWQPAVMQQHSDLSTTVFMGPMGPPSGDDLICPDTRLAPNPKVRARLSQRSTVGSF